MDNVEKATEFDLSLKNFHLPRSFELPELDFYMDQVISIMEKNLYLLSMSGEAKFITPAMINNYVKLGIIPPPKKKRYDKEHICHLFIICTLKSVLPIPSISKIIKAHTKSRSVYELYDMFCEAYENMLLGAAETAKEILAETPDATEAVSKLSLFMAINAGTSQLIATNTIKSFAEQEKPDDIKK